MRTRSTCCSRRQLFKKVTLGLSGVTLGAVALSSPNSAMASSSRSAAQVKPAWNCCAGTLSAKAETVVSMHFGAFVDKGAQFIMVSPTTNGASLTVTEQTKSRGSNGSINYSAKVRNDNDFNVNYILEGFGT